MGMESGRRGNGNGNGIGMIIGMGIGMRIRVGIGMRMGIGSQTMTVSTWFTHWWTCIVVYIYCDVHGHALSLSLVDANVL